MDSLRTQVRDSREKIGLSLLSHNVPSLANFMHSKLDHGPTSIRLIRILPKLSTTGLLQCTSISTSIEAQPYTCLSYRWGSSTNTKKIVMDKKLFQVRGNLYDFLSIVRGFNDLFWIDALCIDQSNSEERNQQVALMGNIYSAAHHVEIWLGAMTRDARRAIHLMLKEDKKLDNDQKLAVEKFVCTNDYWRRAWIIQEIMLPRTVLVRVSHELAELQRLFLAMERQRIFRHSQPIARFKLTETIIDQQGNVYPGRERPEQCASLLSLVAHFRDTKCEIPRDRIYSLLSISREGPDRFAVDYGASDSCVLSNILHDADRYALCACTTLFALRSLEQAQLNSVDGMEKAGPPALLRSDVGPVLDIDYDVDQPLSNLSHVHQGHLPTLCEVLEYRAPPPLKPWRPSNCDICLMLADLLCLNYRVHIPPTGPIQAHFKGSCDRRDLEKLRSVLVREETDWTNFCPGSRCESSHTRLNGISIRAVSSARIRIRIALWALDNMIPARFLPCCRESLDFKPSDSSLFCRVSHRHWNLWHETDREQLLKNPWPDDPICLESEQKSAHEN